MSTRSNQPFYLFVSLYALYNDKDTEFYMQKFTGDCVKSWNNSMKHLKDQFRLTGDAVREVIYFAYVHNPLNLDYTSYGKLSNYYKVIPAYKRWITLYAVEIAKDGFQKTLWATKPEALSDLDRELLKDFEAVTGLY